MPPFPKLTVTNAINKNNTIDTIFLLAVFLERVQKSYLISFMTVSLVLASNIRFITQQY